MAQSSALETPTLAVQLTETPADAETRARLLENPGFGTLFGEHMVRIDYVATGRGAAACCSRTAPIELQPSAAVFHYAQAAFEGLKAFRLADGGVGVFRPDANAARMNRSAQRLAMPELPVERFLEAVDALVHRRRRLGAGAATARASTCGRCCSPPSRSCRCGRRRSSRSSCSTRPAARTSRAA